MAPEPRRSPRGDRLSDRRTYVLDTSVPMAVVGELEAKRDHPELGWFARQSLRLLDDLRARHGRLDSPIPVGADTGTLRVELNHVDPQAADNDRRILSVAWALAADGADVVLVSKDLPLRVRAAALGLAAQEYRAELAAESGWPGTATLDVAAVRETRSV